MQCNCISCHFLVPVKLVETNKIKASNEKVQKHMIKLGDRTQ